MELIDILETKINKYHLSEKPKFKDIIPLNNKKISIKDMKHLEVLLTEELVL